MYEPTEYYESFATIIVAEAREGEATYDESTEESRAQVSEATFRRTLEIVSIDPII